MHFNSQLAASAQLIEQLPVHVTLQVDPALHEMLPLAPSVSEQVASSPQSTLHESPQAPPQLDWAAHPNEQLAPQVWVVTVHISPAAQPQVVPVQVGGLVETPPQAAAQMLNSRTSPTHFARVIERLRFRVMLVRYRDRSRIRQASVPVASGPP
jgi:hypothetical protein